MWVFTDVLRTADLSFDLASFFANLQLVIYMVFGLVCVGETDIHHFHSHFLLGARTGDSPVPEGHGAAAE